MSMSAQQGGASARGRLNQIIAQFEQGKPAFANEHWRLFGIEHNPFAIDDLKKGLVDLRPSGSTRPRMTPIVRIEYEGDQDFKHAVKQYLDVGVMGIIVPHVNTAEEARRLVSAMRYPHQKVLAKVPKEPIGIRGVAAGRAGDYWGLTPDEYATKADVWPLNPEGELLAIVMIEDIKAMKNLRDILRHRPERSRHLDGSRDAGRGSRGAEQTRGSGGGRRDRKSVCRAEKTLRLVPGRHSNPRRARFQAVHPAAWRLSGLS
jgi:hypothetical protein